MKVPLNYSLRNLWARKLTTALTAGGMALVVFVFAAVLMLDEGLKTTLVATGSYDNVLIVRKGSGSEVQSGVERAQAAIVQSRPEVALGEGGVAVVSKEVVVLISLNKRGTEKPSNVVIRGVSPMGVSMRSQIKLVEGRMFEPGRDEVVAGRAIAQRFGGAGLGETVRFGGRDWTVVGVFDAGKSGFDSEIWGDVDQLMPAFRRPVYSSVLLKLADVGGFETLRGALENDPRLQLDVKREIQYYAEQSEVLSKFISYLGITLSIIFSIGAVIGATITMYAAVANRTAEIGTLRALGFRKWSVLIAFVAEAMGLSLVGGLAGVALASLMQLYTVSTLNWQSFAELAFAFTLTPGIIAKSLVFALIMGLVGGVFPAARAARMNIVNALRAA
ncbi:MAG: ABC transporter permease [Rhodocyclaceae bacterium]